jgi:GAF domain-containing protein
MKPAPLPPNEAARLKALKRYQLLNSLPEEEYDDIAKIASEICGTPIALINLIDENKQWTKARYGIDTKETPREHSFCAHAILELDQVMIVPDTRYDERFFDNPLVTNGNPNIAFYAGMPIVNSEGYPLGALCVVDTRPRDLSEQKINSLKALAKLVQTNFELRITKMELEESRERLMVAQPLVNTILNEVEMLETGNLNPDQADQIALFKDTVIAFKTLLEDPGSFQD